MHPHLIGAPVDPLKLAATESGSLVTIGGDFGSRFDGQLEYHAKQNRFLLFYNTKYDRSSVRSEHHARTRFSIAHELGHFFLDAHHAYLRRGGNPHPSRGEFVNDHMIEREADAFAAAMLLPTRLVRPLVNDDELSFNVIGDIAGRFEVSRTCTAIRCVQLSDFPCALVAIRGGVISWSVLSDRLIEERIYPPSRGSAGSANATRECANEDAVGKEHSSTVGRWFRTFDREQLQGVHVTERYLAVPSMDTVLALLTIPEDELCNLKEDDD